MVSGIIVGLDTDTPQTADHIIEFVHASNIPVLTINILYALPKTPLWRRLEAEGRLLADETRESNVVFKISYETDRHVAALHQRSLRAGGRLSALCPQRGSHVHQPDCVPHHPQRASWRNVLMGLGVLGRILWRIGVRGHYRRSGGWPARPCGGAKSSG